LTNARPLLQSRFAAKKSSGISRSAKGHRRSQQTLQKRSAIDDQPRPYVDVEWAKGDGKEIQSVRLLATTKTGRECLRNHQRDCRNKTGIRDARAEVSKNDRV
jgi:hypothetical protein